MKIEVEISDKVIDEIVQRVKAELESASVPVPDPVVTDGQPGKYSFTIDATGIVKFGEIVQRMAWSDDDGWLRGKIANDSQGEPCNWILEDERAKKRHAFIVLDRNKGLYRFPDTIRVGQGGLALKCRYRPGYHSRIANYKTVIGVNGIADSRFHADSNHRIAGPKPEGWQ